MSWRDGIFRCESLGSDDCVVWWDALAAIGSIGAIAATVILGIFTYRLGVAANAASKVALRLAENADAVQARDRLREADVIMQFLKSEFAWTASHIDAFISELRDEDRYTIDLDNEQKETFVKMIPFLQMLETQSLLPRLHVLSDDHVKVVARVLSQSRMYYGFLRRFSDPKEFGRSPLASLDSFRVEGRKISRQLHWLVSEANKLPFSSEEPE